MDINELQRFTGKGHEVSMQYGTSYAEVHRAWSCQFTAQHDGVELTVWGRGATPEEAVAEAARKFDRATFSGLPEMNPLARDSCVSEVETSPGRVDPEFERKVEAEQDFPPVSNSPRRT